MSRKIAYFNGVYCEEGEAKIPVRDRGFLAGDGAYTTIQVSEGQALFLDRHLQRLQKQCADLKMVCPLLEPKMIEDLIEKNGAIGGIWRLKIIITGGQVNLMRLPEGRKGELIMLIEPFTPLPDEPLRLDLFPFPFSICHAHFKSLAHLNRYYVMEYAHQKGCDDAVTTTEKGEVLEASFGNLVWIDSDLKKAWTPDPLLPLHYGVTIGVVEEILKDANYDVEKIRLSIDHLPQCAAFRVNTMSLIRPIASIGPHTFPQNPSLLSFLRQAYRDKTKTDLLVERV